MNLLYLIGFLIIAIIIFYPSIINCLPSMNLMDSFKNQENFTSNQIVFTSYTADWCPHCVEFNSNVYGKLVDHYKGNKNIKITKVDCTNDRAGETKTISGNEINGFPTLMIYIYDNGGNMKEIQYSGNRTAKDIISFINDLK